MELKTWTNKDVLLLKTVHEADDMVYFKVLQIGSKETYHAVKLPISFY